MTPIDLLDTVVTNLQFVKKKSYLWGIIKWGLPVYLHSAHLSVAAVPMSTDVMDPGSYLMGAHGVSLFQPPSKPGKGFFWYALTCPTQHTPQMVIIDFHGTVPQMDILKEATALLPDHMARPLAATPVSKNSNTGASTAQCFITARKNACNLAQTSWSFLTYFSQSPFAGLYVEAFQTNAVHSTWNCRLQSEQLFVGQSRAVCRALSKWLPSRVQHLLMVPGSARMKRLPAPPCSLQAARSGISHFHFHVYMETFWALPPALKCFSDIVRDITATGA